MESAKGEKLKKIRQELGLSLEEVQKKTRINLNILKAIEGDSLTDLSPIYLKGFLKIYCKFLGVEPREYIADYKETQSEPLNVNVSKEVKTRAGKWDLLIAAAKKYSRVLLFILIIFLFSLAVYNLGKIISKHRLRLSKTSPSYTMPQKTESKKEKKAAKAPAVTQRVTFQKNTVGLSKNNIASGIRLGIRASQNCWVDLKVDGKVVFRRVLEKGRFATWQAKERIELSLGNAQAVELEVNGQRFLNLGRKGQALKGIVITKEGLNISR